MNQESIIKRQQFREKKLLQELAEKGDLISKLNSELQESRKMYVPLKVYPKPRPVRRHTMGVPSDIRSKPMMEAILEHPVNEEEENMPNNHIIPQSHSEVNLQSETSLTVYTPVSNRGFSEPLKKPDFECTIEKKCEPNVIDEAKYHDLMTNYNNLDKSHATLKEFTKLELEIHLQDETMQLRRELDELLKQNLKFQEEITRLKQSYEVLDVSHFDLKEFTKIEMDLAVEERTQRLQKEIDELRKNEINNNLQQEYDKLKERLSIMESEQEFMQQAQNQQLQRRCEELLSRITELERQPNQTTKPCEDVTFSVENDKCEDKINLEALQDKCGKLEATIKFTEMHSKLLLKENNALKGYKPKLTRSLSDTNLADSGEGLQDEEYNREDFQRIFKSLRSLTATIISGVDLEQASSIGPPIAIDRNPIGRMRSKSEKPSFSDRMSEGLQEDEIDDLKKENVMYKELTNDLLAKLKNSNDKFNARDISQYEETIKRLEEDKSELELKLRNIQDGGHSEERKVDAGNEAYLRELEDKIKQLEGTMQECEGWMGEYKSSQAKIEQLTNELNALKNQEQDGVNSDCLPNQNSKFIEELQEKLKLGNDVLQQNEIAIRQLREQLSQKEKEHHESNEKLKLLEEKIQSNNLCTENVTNKVDNNLSEEIEELKRQVAVKEEQIVKLEAEIKQKEHDHYMDKEALEYSSSELDEAMVKIRELQVQIKNLKAEESQKVDQLHKEIDLYKEYKTAKEAETVKVEQLSTEITIANDMLSEKNVLLEQTQNELALLQDALDKTKMAAESAQTEHQQEIDAMKLKMDLLQADHDENNVKLVKFETLLADKEKLCDELQVKLDKLVEEYLMTTNVHREVVQKFEIKISELNILIEKQQHQYSTEQTQKLENEKGAAVIAEKNELIEDLQAELHNYKITEQNIKCEIETKELRLKELTLEISELQSELIGVKTQWEDDKKQIAQMQDMLTIQEGVIKNLEEQFDAAKQEGHNHMLAALSNENKLQALIAEMEHRQVENGRLKEDTTENDLKLLNTLQEQCDDARQECLKYKMAAEENQNRVEEYKNMEISLKEQHKLELDACKSKITLLQEEIANMGLLRDEIVDLRNELVEIKNINTVTQEKMLKEHETILAEHKSKSIEVKTQLENELHVTIMKLKSLEEEIAALKATSAEYLDHGAELQELNQKYEEAVVKIVSMQDKNKELRKEYDANLANAKESYKLELDACNSQILVLKEKLAEMEHLQVEIERLKQELVNIKNNHQKDQEKLVKHYKDLLEESKSNNEKDHELLTALQRQCDEAKQECLKYKMAADARENQAQEHNKVEILLKKQHKQELQSCQSKISSLQEEVTSMGVLQNEIVQLRNELARIKDINTETQEKLVKEYENKLQASKSMEVKTQLEKELQATTAKLKSLEEEIAALKATPSANTDHSEAFIELNKKYEEAVVKIASMQDELQSLKAVELMVTKITAEQDRFLKVLTSLSDEEKIKRLEDELHKKRYELRLDRDKSYTLQREYDLVVKSKTELQAKLDALQSEAKPKTNKLLSGLANKTNEAVIKSLEEDLSKSNKALKEAEETIKTMKKDQDIALNKIKELEGRLVSSREELNQNYEQLKQEFYINNQPKLKIDDKEIVELRNELQANQKLHQRKVAAMTDDFENKYQAYSDKYALLKKSLESTTRNKDAIIKELQSRLEQSNKENTSKTALADEKQSEANANRKIFMLQQQLQAIKTDLQQKQTQYEYKIDKLKADYQMKLNAMKSELDSMKSEVVLPSEHDLAGFKTKEQFAKRIDTELFSIPSKLSILLKISNISILPFACGMCRQIQGSLLALIETCKKHSSWYRFNPHETAKDKQIGTDRFDLLAETRDVFVQLLQLRGNNKETRDLIKVRLDATTREIDDYVKSLEEKHSFLAVLHEALKASGVGIAQHLNAAGVAVPGCEQCQLYKLCFNVVCALTERIKCSLIIIEGFENRLNPHQFCIDNVRACEAKLEQLMVKLNEHSSDVSIITYKDNITILNLTILIF